MQIFIKQIVSNIITHVFQEQISNLGHRSIHLVNPQNVVGELTLLIPILRNPCGYQDESQNTVIIRRIRRFDTIS